MSPRILIVDDDPDIRTILSLRLGRVGFEVMTANDGLDGLAAVQQAFPSGVVLDLFMPNMSGFEFLSRLRQLQPLSPPVFVVTQADDVLVRERVHLLGAERLISKSDALGREFAETLARRLGGDTSRPLPTAPTGPDLGFLWALNHPQAGTLRDGPEKTDLLSANG